MNRVVKISAWTLAALALSWVVIRFGDLLFGWALYGWFFRRIQGVGVLPNALASAAAVWCVAAVIIAGPTALLSLFAFGARRHRAVLAIAGAVSLWIVSLYLLAGLRPADYFFNPESGETNYSYGTDPTGAIALFPKEYRFNPLTGAKLAPLDAATGEAYRRQQGVREAQLKQAEVLRQEQAQLATAQAELHRQQAALRDQQDTLAQRERAVAARAEEEKTRAGTPAPHTTIPATPSEPSDRVGPALEVTPPTTITFNPGVVCRGDERKTLNYAVDIDKETIVVPLTEGCYGPLVILPDTNRWRPYWKFRNATTAAGWVAFLSSQKETDPIGLPTKNPGRLSTGFGMGWYGIYAFRVQGHGTVRLEVNN